MAKVLQNLENKRQIYVTPEGANGPQVTFDNNADENCWWFHQGKNDPHGTEVFEHKVASRERGTVNILSDVLSKKTTDLYLTVREDSNGLEPYPKFRSKNDTQESESTVTMHTEFTQENSETDQMIAFSFNTAYDNRKVYLVPSSVVSKITCKITDDPQYVFQLGKKLTKEELEEISENYACEIK